MENKVNLRPLGNRVVVMREATEEMKGGIIIPDTAKQEQETAKVVAVGPGKLNRQGDLTPMPVKIGDNVLLEKYAGHEIELDDKKYTILNADEIIAIVE
ncbi:MAG: co-chaperone GroES [Chlamydiota bacterium]